MSKLSEKQRDALPSSTFAGPGRSFPIPDKNHAKAALIDVGRAHNLTPEQKAHIKRQAKLMLSK